jgi:hypothetical protein
MKRVLTYFTTVLLCGSASLYAAEAAPTDERLLLPESGRWIVAEAQQAAAPQPSLSLSSPQQGEGFAEYEEPWFNGNKLHQYLGIGSITLATLALLSPKEEDGPHEYFARGAAGLGGAAVASGLIVHWDDIANGGGLGDPDNQHALLASLGALGFALAVSQAPDEAHAGAGATGFVAMAIGIRLTW